MEPPVIQICKLTKHYGDVQALVGLDLTVVRGEVFGFLGPNGAGKSTTIRLLMDLVRPTSGSATILGMDSRHDGVAVRRSVGYLPGELALYERMTGAQFLNHICQLRGGANDGLTLAALTDRFKVDLSRPIRTLSRGNKQKIGILYAFMHRPALLILDEPTTGLDPLMQQEFYALLRETRAEGRTVFMSSHNLPEVDQVADRVGIIRDGHLAAVEGTATLKARTPRQLMVRVGGDDAAPLLARLVGLSGVSDLKVNGDSVWFSVGGSPDRVVKELANFEIMDLVTQEPSLETVFLSYYGKPGDGIAGAGDPNEDASHAQ